MSFLFYLRWSLYHPVIHLGFLFYLRWTPFHPIYRQIYEILYRKATPRFGEDFFCARHPERSEGSSEFFLFYKI